MAPIKIEYMSDRLALKDQIGVIIDAYLDSNAVYFDQQKFKGKYTDDHDAAWLELNPVGSPNNPITSIGTSTPDDPSGGVLTWASIGDDMENYNSNMGMRKESTGSTGWEIPSYAACTSKAIETLTSGQAIIATIDAASAACGLVISNDAAPTMFNFVNVDYGVYAGYGLTPQVKALQAGDDVGDLSPNLATGDKIKIAYGTNMVVSYSQNGGTSWTVLYTSDNTPSGTYNIFVQSYSALGGFKEISIA